MADLTLTNYTGSASSLVLPTNIDGNYVTKLGDASCWSYYWGKFYSYSS